jgi:biotin carboxyl carrier protein
MQYQAKIGEQTYTVDIEERGGELRVRLNGLPTTADLRQVSALGLFSLLIDGQSYEVFAEEREGGYAVAIGGELYQVQIEDEWSLRLSRAAPRVHLRRGAMVVKSPMPGLVVSVAVQVGDAVAEGQTLTILEAMKLENEIRSPQAGTVKAVHIAPGKRVEEGDKLVTIV